MNTASDEAEISSTKSFVLQVASVSPIYSNNPTFRIMSLDTRKRALVDHDQYYLDLILVTEFAHPVWKSDSTFSRKYPSKNKLIDADRINELNRKLISQTEGRYWNEYMPSTTSHYQLGSYDRLALYCVMRYVFEEDFKKCLEKFKVPGG